jgi:putative transposase
MLEGMKLAPQELRTYFVTTVTANRRRLFQVSEAADLMLEVLQHYRKQNKFALHGFVIMPDHLHLLLTPAFDVSLEKTLQYIKGGFSFRLKSKREVWERGFYEVQIRTSDKFRACRRYIEENPLRAALAQSLEGFTYSSAFPVHDVDPMPDHFRQLTSRG